MIVSTAAGDWLKVTTTRDTRCVTQIIGLMSASFAAGDVRQLPGSRSTYELTLVKSHIRANCAAKASLVPAIVRFTNVCIRERNGTRVSTAAGNFQKLVT